MTAQAERTKTFHGYAAKAQGEKLQPHDFVSEPLGPYDMEVKISHCGICHSDIHLIDNDWGTASYPLVPGHEIIGKVVTVGESVEGFHPGERVGIGWQRSSCMHCDWCDTGQENLCLSQEATCVGHPGGFADSIRVDGRFAFPIPEELPSAQTAPLLCGGITVFSPFLEHNIGPTHRVGVIGIGGLGHLAIQFAAAFGCEVTAFSHSSDKEKEAKKLGADHFISSTDTNALKQAENSLDFLLCTTPTSLNWEEYLQTLRPKGILCFVGVQSKPIQIPSFSIISRRKTVCGSNIGSRPDIRAMLQFCAQHGIKAEVETFPMDQVNQAIEKVRSGNIRYRAVLTNGNG